MQKGSIKFPVMFRVVAEAGVLFRGVGVAHVPLPCPAHVQCFSVTAASVLTVHIACFLFAGVLVLVEREFSRKEVLFTLVIE